MHKGAGGLPAGSGAGGHAGLAAGGIKKTNAKTATNVSAIPAVATRRGSILSESLPVNGEKMAIMAGWASITSPA